MHHNLTVVLVKTIPWYQLVILWYFEIDYGTEIHGTT